MSEREDVTLYRKAAGVIGTEAVLEAEIGVPLAEWFTYQANITERFEDLMGGDIPVDLEHPSVRLARVIVERWGA